MNSEYDYVVLLKFTYKQGESTADWIGDGYPETIEDEDDAVECAAQEVLQHGAENVPSIVIDGDEWEAMEAGPKLLQLVIDFLDINCEKTDQHGLENREYYDLKTFVEKLTK